MDQNEQMAAMNQRQAYTETDRLVARIDADIRKLQEWRAYVLGQSGVPAYTDFDAAPKKPRKPRRKRGMPAQESGL